MKITPPGYLGIPPDLPPLLLLLLFDPPPLPPPPPPLPYTTGSKDKHKAKGSDVNREERISSEIIVRAGGSVMQAVRRLAPTYLCLNSPIDLIISMTVVVDTGLIDTRRCWACDSCAYFYSAKVHANS
jgi:hypothetical protein